MTGMLTPRMQAAGLHRPDKPLRDSLPMALPHQGRKQFGGRLPQAFGGFGQTAVGILPGCHHQEPLLQDGGDHLGIKLTENAPAGVASWSPFIDQASLFPARDRATRFASASVAERALATR